MDAIMDKVLSLSFNQERYSNINENILTYDHLLTRESYYLDYENIFYDSALFIQGMQKTPGVMSPVLYNLKY